MMESMESLLKNLKEHLTCPICLDTYTEPKTIVCLHTFCCECLKKHALASQKQGQFECPECQAQVSVPEGNHFDDMPNSSHHERLLILRAVQQSGDGSEIVCGNCKKKSAETSYCFDCGRFMCPVCLNAHERLRNVAFVGHKFTPVKQFQVEDYEALFNQPPFCSQHKREAMKFYCRECEICVCQICIVTDHKNHDVDSLDKVADEERAAIMARVELLKEKKKACYDVLRELEEAASELETNVATVKREVTQAADDMIARIREQEREVITSLENTRVSTNKKSKSNKKRSP